MMRWLAILLIFCSGAAVAQQAVVRSGAHPGFTRITVPLAKDTDWSMGRTEDGYAVRLDPPATLELGRIYRRIDRKRLSDVSYVDGILSLSVPCDCFATAFRYLDRYLVVDIRDGSADSASIFENPFGGPRGGVETPLSVADLPKPPGRMMLPLAPGTAPVPVAASPGDGLAEPQTFGNPIGPTPAISDLERNVADSLARAASQGLLTLSEPLADNVAVSATGAEAETFDSESPLTSDGTGNAADLSPDASDHAATVSPTSESFAQDHIGTRPMEGTPGLTARTSLDTLQALIDAARPATAGSGLCWPSDFTDLTWNGEDPVDFGTHIGALRAAISDDRDQADSTAVAALARGYLSFGFGREALQTLAIDGITDRGRVALRAMAEVVDDIPQSGPELAQQIGCPGSTSLWALLASGRSEDVDKVDRDQVVQQFKMLPDPLQTVLGPRLADLLRRANRADLAELVLTPAGRMPTPSVEAALVETALAVDRGDIATATGVLADAAEVNPRMTPEAMVKLVDLQLSQGEAIAPETLSLLETMQFEYRKRPIAAELMRARVAALAQTGAVEAALAELPSAEAALPEKEAARLRSTVVDAVTLSGDDMTFLDLAFRPEGEDVAPDVQNKVAQRLLDLGFPDRAAEVVGGSAIGGVMAERRYLRASAAMAMDDPEEAATQLAGVTTPRALSILGQSPDATAGDGGTGTDAAWRTGDWSALATSDDTLLQEAAALVQQDTSPIADTQTPLASSRALIEDAARARATIDTLMARFAPPS